MLPLLPNVVYMAINSAIVMVIFFQGKKAFCLAAKNGDIKMVRVFQKKSRNLHLVNTNVLLKCKVLVTLQQAFPYSPGPWWTKGEK